MMQGCVPRSRVSRNAVTIHILEDDAGVRDSLVVLLRNIGHDAVPYPDAEAFFSASPPGGQDTVIIDLHLPGISGVNVIRWLKQLRDQPAIIAISGQAQMVIEAQLRGMDVPNLLRKPLTEDTLTAFLGRPRAARN